MSHPQPVPLAHRMLAELARRLLDQPTVNLPAAWRDRLALLFPTFTGWADHHATFWDWEDAIGTAAEPAPAFVGVWSRAGAKSSNAELAVTDLGIRGLRKYALYCCETQEQADNHVGAIAGLLQSPGVERHAPEHAKRALTKYGASKGWRRNRLWTEGGFVVDAIGLDTAARGAKVEAQRPDIIVLDDLDGELDSDHRTANKLTTLAKAVLPMGTPDAVIIAIQNLIIPHGIFAQLLKGRADILARRVTSGPHPAIRGMVTEVQKDSATGQRRAVITAGEPTWPHGQGLAACQELMDRIGLRAFLEECQHEVDVREGALWKPSMFRHQDAAPRRFRRVAVAVDPSGGSNEIGIVAGGLGYDDNVYVLADRTAKGSLGALHWGEETVRVFDELEADGIVAERNFGGDMVESNIRVAAGNERRIVVRMVHASRGKAIRADPVAALYSDGHVIHVGAFERLERELTSWVPGESQWSPNRLDALVWLVTDLMGLDPTKGKRQHIRLTADALAAANPTEPSQWRIE